MGIAIEYKQSIAVMKNGEFRCPHDNIEVEKACCSSVSSSGYIECGCGGQDSVYCYDCQNEDMTDKDMEGLV